MVLPTKWTLEDCHSHLGLNRTIIQVTRHKRSRNTVGRHNQQKRWQQKRAFHALSVEHQTQKQIVSTSGNDSIWKQSSMCKQEPKPTQMMPQATANITITSTMGQ
uniref:Uncharacterized protein n=1 Tax=Spongospora subterranea TaxID=70186 RepID=A0A0H5QVV0_9EUKA|eukprot:CRZ05862.1 hypothetical protein [Spongospora subterranea]